MPAQDRIGRDNRRNLAQHTPAQMLPAPRQTAPLLVSHPQSSATELSPQSSILFDQIGDDVLLLVIHPNQTTQLEKCGQGRGQSRRESTLTTELQISEVSLG